jgi:3-deoxy-D-manno-octulosonic-acid transferase
MGSPAARSLYERVSALAGVFRWRSPASEDIASEAADPTIAQIPERPEGRVVWCHGVGAEDLAAIEALIPRLAQAAGEPCAIVATTPGPIDAPVGAGTLHQIAPGDSPAAATRFADHWRPDLGIVCGPSIHPALLKSLKSRGVPVLWVNAVWERSGHRWRRWADDTRMSDFHRIFPATRRDADELRQSGVAPERIEVRGLLREAPVPLTCNEGERDALARRLASRPVWLATTVTPTTVDDVEAAHRSASRLSHRLLLVAVPEAASEGAELAAAFESKGWTVGRRSAGHRLDSETQVYIADVEGEMGLWYRLAPVTFLAATLDPLAAGPSPFDAAALGSAVVHGPHHGIHKARFERLSLAGASRQIGAGADLGPLLTELLAPDKTAALAEAAWRVTSDGAPVADRVIETLIAALEGEGTGA